MGRKKTRNQFEMVSGIYISLYPHVCVYVSLDRRK